MSSQLRFYLAELLVASITLNLLGLILPLVLMQIYDRVIPNAAFETLWLLVAAVAAAVLLEALLRYLRSYLSGWIGTHFEHQAGCLAVSRLLTARFADFSKIEAGNYLQKLSSIPIVKDHYSGQVLTVFMDMPFVVIYLGLIYYLGGILVLVPVALLCFEGAVVLAGARRLRRNLQEQSKGDDRRFSFLIEVMGGIHSVKSMAMEAPMLRRYERLQTTSASAHLNVVRESADALDVSASFSQLMTIAVAATGGLLVLQEQMSVGVLAACTLLAGRTAQPLQRATSMWTRWQSVGIARGHLHDILSLPSESERSLPPLPPLEGGITLRNVTFCYDRDADPVVRTVSVTVAPGEMIGITGPGGCGKSTLLSMISGLVEPKEGEVLLDGYDLRDFDRASIRRRVAFVPQNGVVFNGTIIDNLTMFRPELAEAAVELSVAIGLDQIVAHMPLGYDTRIGDAAADVQPRGVNQRIAIVRALVCNPRIILFDEANSALDSAGDQKVHAFLQSLRGRCTVILVTLRPSWLRAADRSFEMRSGMLVPYGETGRHLLPVIANEGNKQ